MELERERKTTGSVIEKQEKEIQDCKSELDQHRENEKKLKARAKELQDELDQTLRRIEQLQRGQSTPLRRKPVTLGGSRNASPYSRNSSGAKKTSTPGGSQAKSTVYSRLNQIGKQTSSTRVAANGVKTQSPTGYNRGSGTYKPPQQRTGSNNARQSPMNRFGNS